MANQNARFGIIFGIRSLRMRNRIWRALNYVHQNAIKHGLVPVANQYQWCSARWFEQIASSAMVRSIYRFKIDRLSIRDDFAPVLKPEPPFPKRRSTGALQNATRELNR